jgi:hypothetical protein
MDWNLGVLAAAALAATASTAAEIRTDDVALFYRVYDAGGGKPTAEQLQKGYLDAGSEGVRQFIPNRIRSAEALAQRIGERPLVYERARACAAALPDVRARLAAATAKLKAIYPAAADPQVTVLIGRDNSAGTTGAAGVLIGLETVCRADHLQADLADRLTSLLAHEMVHVEQARAMAGVEQQPTVLSQSLAEGVADFLAELLTGEPSNVHLHRWNRGREAEIARAFMADLDKTDLSAWLYNDVGTAEKPGDQGYWVGYQIAKAYYDRAPDKRAAVAELIAPKDPRAILERSGWGR